MPAVGGWSEFVTDQHGMHVRRPFRHVTGILAGTPVHASPADVERIWSRFDDEPDAAQGANSPAPIG
jgi:hypothetical protein